MIIENEMIVSDERVGVHYENNTEKSAEFCKNLGTSYLHTWFEDDAGKAYLEYLSKYQELVDVVYKCMKPVKESK